MILQNNQKGTVLLFTILILGSTAIIALLALSRSGIDEFSDSVEQSESIEVRENIFGCLDELLLQFQVDENYSTALIDTLDAQCSVVITTPQAGERVANISLDNGNVYRGLQVEFNVTPVTVTRVIEINN